jgi:hypothetical protein
MSVAFTFRYEPAYEEKYEVEEATSDFFVSLFDADAELFNEGDLLPSFVQQYREQSQSSTPDDSGDREVESMEWGPSTPFLPSEARRWAQRWVHLLQEADEETLTDVFFYTVDPHPAKLELERKYTVEDLQKVVAQAECAEQHDARMTVEVVWG